MTTKHKTIKSGDWENLLGFSTATTINYARGISHGHTHVGGELDPWLQQVLLDAVHDTFERLMTRYLDGSQWSLTWKDCLRRAVTMPRYKLDTWYRHPGTHARMKASGTTAAGYKKVSFDDAGEPTAPAVDTTPETLQAILDESHGAPDKIRKTVVDCIEWMWSTQSLDGHRTLSCYSKECPVHPREVSVAMTWVAEFMAA